MHKIKSTLKGIYEHPSLRKSIVPLFIGNPGLGKTVLIEEFAKERGVKVVEFITSQMSPFEISGISFPDQTLKKMIYYNFDRLLSLEDGDILFFDELLNGNPTVLAACLTLLEGRKMISGQLLPDIMIVAAANRQGMTPITPQIKERFVWYDVNFNREMWVDFMIGKYDITRTIGDKLSDLIKAEDFTKENFYTPRSLDKALDMILKDVPTPYESYLLPILKELIKNDSGVKIPLSSDRDFMPDECIPWIELIKYKNYGTTEK